MTPCQWQHFTGAWLAASSSLANNHLWGSLALGPGGHADSPPGPLAPTAKAGLPFREEGTPPKSSSEAARGAPPPGPAESQPGLLGTEAHA